MPYGHQIWWEESLTKVQYIAGVKGHAGVSWGQVGVSLFSNVLWSPNLVGRTPNQSVMHYWGQRSCKGQSEVKLLKNAVWLGSKIQGSAGVNLRSNSLRNALWPPNLVGRIPDQSSIHCWGQRSCRGQLGSSRGQFV